jgi:phosphoglycolate phosphatase
MSESLSRQTQLETLIEGAQAICFDLDGTLLAINRKAREGTEPSRSLVGHILSWAKRNNLIKRFLYASEVPSNYVLAFLERLGVNTDTLLTDRFRTLRGLGTRTASRLVPDAEPVLVRLQKSHRLAVVTARSHRAARYLLRQHELLDYFEVITTRQDTWLLKPNPSPVRRTARLLGVPAEDCLMIGDTFTDMRSAKRAGAMAIGVLTGLGSRGELERAGADLILNGVADMLPVLINGPEET